MKIQLQLYQVRERVKSSLQVNMASSQTSHHHPPTISSPNPHPLYQVEHLATFSTTTPQNTLTTPKMALQRLFAMEKTSGIWTQRMTIEIDGRDLKIIDGDSGETVERFPVSLIQHPTAFTHHNHIYDNILIFIIQHPEEASGELHIFQCNSQSAQQVVEELNHWMRRHGNPYVNNNNNNNDGGVDTHHSNGNSNRVKAAVNVFNAIARERESRGGGSIHSVSPPPHTTPGHHHHPHAVSSHPPGSSSSHDQQQSLNNERYVSILNHCFDDIERFIIRLQHAAAALRELQLRQQQRKGKKSRDGGPETGDGLLAVRARGPSEEEFFEILSKFKLAFNLLAKLKGCIHDPNAPELVHFLFTPLAIIIEAARSNVPNPIDPTVVGLPFLNTDAIELLKNCCTSKEYDLWHSLGINWTHPVRQHVLQSPSSRNLPMTFQPVFTDGWAPTITEQELMGFTSSSSDGEDHETSSLHLREGGGGRIVGDEGRPSPSGHHHHRRVGGGGSYDDSDADDPAAILHHERVSSLTRNGNHNNSSGHHRVCHSSSPSAVESDSLEGDSSPNGVDIEQAEWLSELSSRNGKVVKVLFPRTANNDKELTVVR